MEVFDYLDEVDLLSTIPSLSLCSSNDFFRSHVCSSNYLTPRHDNTRYTVVHTVSRVSTPNGSIDKVRLLNISL